MPLEIEDQGHGNVIDIDPSTLETVNGTVELRGSNNRIVIKPPFSAAHLRVDLSDQSSLTIEAGCFAGFIEIYALRGGSVNIGRNCSFNGTTRLLLHEPGRIDVGGGCLFGPDIDVVNSDMHSIVDVETGVRLNPARDVTIGDHVWLGIKTFVAKGSRIGGGAVVGAYSFVAGHIPPNSLAIGAPARVQREGVTWKFELI